MDISMDFDNKEFKKAFWEWFDVLPEKEKDKFKYYRSDMAELYFYNSVYKKLINEKDFYLQNYNK